MKKLIISLLALSACVACSDTTKKPAVLAKDEALKPNADASLECCPVQAPILTETGQEIEAPDLSQATDFGNMKIELSPYNFASIEALRASVFAQANKEGIAPEVAETSFDDFAEMLVINHIEMLEECEDDAAADAFMMKLFMRAMAAKPLKEIFGLK